MAFGVLYDMDDNNPITRITKASDLVQKQWFLDAVNHPEPIDIYIIIGHNPTRQGRNTASTFKTIQQAIRSLKPDVPIQIHGGHTHQRDFVVYDASSTALEPGMSIERRFSILKLSRSKGRYCETLGFLSIIGFPDRTYPNASLSGIPTPTRVALSTKDSMSGHPRSPFRYFRRYLDWNRLTFQYHANGSQNPFDTVKGGETSKMIRAGRLQLNLTQVYGCAPRTFCKDCVPLGDTGNLFTLLQDILTLTLVQQSRSSTPRMILFNERGIRYDLPKGIITMNDALMIHPYKNAFKYIKDVDYDTAVVSQI
jgi:hypothetical protein